MTKRCHTNTTVSIAGGSVGALFRAMTVAFALLLVLVVRECSGQDQQQQQLMMQQQQQMQQHIAQLSQALQERPRDADAHFLLGWAMYTIPGMQVQAMELLKSSLDPEKVDLPLQQQWPLQGFLAAHLIGRYVAEKKDSQQAQTYIELAYEISKTRLSPNRDVGEVCTHLMLATELDPYPLSNQDVDESVARAEKWANLLVDLYTKQKHKDVYLNQEWMGKVMPNFSKDPYVHCLLTLFPLSFYYRADVAKIAHLHYQLAVLAFPKLLYTAQHVRDFDQKQLELASNNTTSGDASDAPPLVQTCVDRKIKLGVVSSTLTEGHSVAEDFGGILQRLNREVFEVTYHLVHERSTPKEAAAFLTANPTDRLYHYAQMPDEINDGAWVRRIGKQIEAFQLDMIFYPDLTMGTQIRRIGMERLAPVQINSHGHPLTSGIPRHTIQHFVSWAEAELPLEESQTHYTEELQLIPKGKLHQFYTPRVTTGAKGRRRTRVTGMPFDHFTRKAFDELPAFLQTSSPDDDDIHLYVCMQKPFKLFPEFDELVCGILREDPHGHAILHKETQTGHTHKFVQRLQAAGCDMDRVHFVSPQPSHLLLALYKTSSVILDSYPAGGCTTSREALELGKAIVTWPARLLGGRWTLGLYKTIGLDEATQTKVIANSKEEYIAKAVALGTNPSLRKDVEQKISAAIPTLFGRTEAVEEWEKIFLRVSPVKQCQEEDTPKASDEL